MNRARNPNLLLLELAVERLGPLAEEFVFLGGRATGLLISDPAAPPIRETTDVDVIVQVLTRGEYYALSDRLRVQGFREDQSEGAPLCRWTDGRVELDVMPINPALLGFGNDWYEPAIKHAVEMALPSGKAIRVVTAPYFLMTKLEAFDGRGAGDFQLSHDIEDIVAVLDGRPEIVNEVARSEDSLRDSLAGRFTALLDNPRFLEAISGHLPTDNASQARVPVVINRMEKVADVQ